MCSSRLRRNGFGFLALVGGVVLGFAPSPSLADRIENGVAVFSALDKVTATIKKLEIPLNETVLYGALKVTPRACYSRPPTEPPKTSAFVEVVEVQLDGQEKRIFSGWMFAESPGLNAVEHPVFDVWLTECQKPSRTISQPKPNAGGVAGAGGADTGQGALEPPPDDLPQRRVRR